MEKIRKVIDMISEVDFSLGEKAQERLNNLTKPQGSLGRLEELAKRIIEITGKENPPIANKVIFTMAGDHGVTEENISAYPKEVTAQMVYNFLSGGAGINVLARHIGARVVVVDMGVIEKINPSTTLRIDGERSRTIKNFVDKKINYGTKNMAKGPAMTQKEAIQSIEAGIEVFENEFQNGIDIVGTGDMGIGNTTSSSAIASVITGKKVSEVTGRGTGISDDILARKIEIIDNAIGLNKPNQNDPIDILSKIGGFEIGGLVGVILAAASRKIPVVIDGFISGAAALISCKLKPIVSQYIIASHQSVERGHRIILDYMGLKPLLDLNLRLGEGTGAALGMSLIEAGIKILAEMATFEGASVSEQINR